jgi:hypothetical protein
MALPPGVPNLLNAGVSFLNPIEILTADIVTNYGFGTSPQWGLFLNGVPIVIADTVVDFGYQQAWTVADYPVERGGFESYDKVNSPFRVRIQFVSGGSEANRQALLDSIAAIGDQLTLFYAVTPEAIYPSVNVEHYEYRRTSKNGLGLMIVDVSLLEIRESQAGNFQNTASPSGFKAAPAGNIQAPTTTPPSGVQ